MASDWQIVAFPLILSWHNDFWTLPLYFPDLKVGVTPGWPTQLQYQGLPLPPEALAHPHEFKHYKPGDFRQMKAFEEYQEALVETGDLLGDLRHYGQEQTPPEDSASRIWSLAWQIEKLQADQEAQLALVDRGQGWLKDILTPEPWEERPGFGQVTGIPEMVDPDLARLRYALWRRVMAPHLQEPWTPLLLGRTSRSLFLTLKGWPEWTGLKRVQFTLPGVQSAEEWRTVCVDGAPPPWQGHAVELLDAMLDEGDDLQDLENAATELREFLADEVLPKWPFPVIGNFDLEIWVADSDDEQPVICWSGAGTGMLPG